MNPQNMRDGSCEFSAFDFVGFHSHGSVLIVAKFLIAPGGFGVGHFVFPAEPLGVFRDTVPRLGKIAFGLVQHFWIVQMQGPYGPHLAKERMGNPPSLWNLTPHFCRSPTADLPYFNRTILMQSRSEFLHAFLLQNGYDPTTASLEIIAQAEAEYKRYYNREKKREYRSRDVTKQVRMTKAEATLIEQNAKRHNQTVGPFIKACTLAYLQKTFVLPDDEQVRNVVFQIRAIGNNINQLAHLANRRQSEEVVDWVNLRQQLNQVEAIVKEILTKPPTVVGLVGSAIRANPNLILQLQQVLDEYSDQ